MQQNRQLGRLDGLTGLRAFAAVWVLAYHYSLGPLRPLGTAHASPFVDAGYLSVDLFFMLSGFVIWHVHGHELSRPSLRNFGRFLCLRLARLYPVHLFTLGLLACLVVMRPQWGDPPLNPADYTQRQFLLHLMLVQSWGFTHHLAWNYPSWSVSAEWFCYLLFPALALSMARFGRRGTLLGVALLVLAIGVAYATVFRDTLNQAVGALTLLRAAPEFFLGCMLRHLVGQMDLKAWPWTAILAGLAVVWVVSFVTVLPVGLLAIPLFAAMILTASVSDGVVTRVLSLPPVVAVGSASYSLYLMQAPVQRAAHILRGDLSLAHPWRDAGVIAVYLLLLAVGSSLVHIHVEDPSRRWLRQRIDEWLPRHRASRWRAPAGMRTE